MGLGHKWESDVFQYQVPFRIPDITPVETKPDWSMQPIQQILWQIQQLNVAVGQLHQVVTAGHAFTRAAPAVEMGGVAEEVRRLSQRLDAIESRLPQQAAAQDG